MPLSDRHVIEPLPFPKAEPSRAWSRGPGTAAMFVLAAPAAILVWTLVTRVGAGPKLGVPPPRAAQVILAGTALLENPADASNVATRRTLHPASARQDKPASQANGRSTPAPGSKTPPPGPTAPASGSTAPVSAASVSPHQRSPVDEILIIPMPEAGAGPVFSSADPEIEPPVLVRPRLNIPAQPQEHTGGSMSVEAVISESGDVELVKLVSPVRDYREAMMLSAVKAWQFKAATRDGYPVRYRMRIRLNLPAIGTSGR